MSSLLAKFGLREDFDDACPGFSSLRTRRETP